MTVGILVIHGFTGGPYEVEPLVQYLQHTTHYLIESITLSGHGEDLQLNGYTHMHWLMEAELAFRTLQRHVDRIVVIGFSMGGLIAMYLAKRYPVYKLVLLSAAAKYVSPVQLTRDLQILVNDTMRGVVKDNSMYQNYRRKFRKVPLQAVIEFLKCTRKVSRYIAHLTLPIFIVQGQRDEVVPYVSAQYLYNKISSSEKYLYMSQTGKHLICYSEDCAKWFEKVRQFIIVK